MNCNWPCWPCWAQVLGAAPPGPPSPAATIWTPLARFTGPALADVLAHVQAVGEVIQLTALNDCSVEVPWTAPARYAPILAHSRVGQRIGVAKYGPLWLMYPGDDFATELNGHLAASRFIWQVKAIKVM